MAETLKNPAWAPVVTTLEQLPADHPIRQENARLTARLALVEGRIASALDYLDKAADGWPRRSFAGQLVEAIGCRLTGRNGSWHPGDRA